ncbi:MAG TPA: AMP-binding protein [Oscillospiraceae bacterium]|nr:AMP-binding protein [Oscillospiraceae bacterium]HNW04366.1 AMP-binding protein [Oscillospiraceae bacterium]HPV99970.1 AMP-binding protein [Oscillospiraceae bacterium]
MNELISITVGKLLSEDAKKFPDREMIKYNDRDYRRTWKEFDEETDRIARGFMAMGLHKGDHVAIWATNVPAWIMTLFASAKIGAVLVTVNTAYKVFELEYLLRQSDAKALVLIDGFKDTSYTGILNELCPTLKDSAPGMYENPMLPFLKDVIYAGDGETPAGMFGWNELYSMADAVSEEELRELSDSLDPQDVVNMQYTSGTTGFPKGVMLTHYNIVNNGLAIGDCMKFTEDDKLCVVVPFFHCFGLVLAIMACVTHCASLVPVEFYSPPKVMKAISEENCTAFHGVPTMFIGLLQHPQFHEFSFSHLRTGIMAGSPCPIKVMRQVVSEMGARDITITYGLTEASPATTMTTTDDTLELRVATIGRHMPFVETKIVDPETGRTLGPGEIGEFCSRGYNTMKGYYKMEEATKQAIDKDGWLHSGDLATVDEMGYYKITGRIKDMIIRGGENIYPKELEEFLYLHPAVSDVQVIGVPSERYGEEIMACVIKKADAELTEQEIKDFMSEKLARHKVPSYVVFVDSFPMTASGKIQKFKLREWAADYLNLRKKEQEGI